MTERLRKSIAVMVVVATVVVVASVIAVEATWSWAGRMTRTPPPTSVDANEPVFTDLIQESIRGVVHLQAPSWQASGFIVGPRLIATARHVVEGVEDFLITTSDDHQVRATRAISDKEHDVAFVYVDDLTCIAEERGTLAHEVVLIPLDLGPIKDCVLGQDVYIVGSPFGKVNFNTVSRGIISGLGRDWDETDPHTRELYGWAVAFTSDSSASPGNSGGPIFTMDGVVRGVLVGGYNSTVNCLMPSDLFMNNLDSIRAMFLMNRYKVEEIEETSEYQSWDGYGAKY